MQSENEKFKNEFKRRLYVWVLRLVKFVARLPKDMVGDVLGKQVLRSGTSILANYVEAKAASSKKDFINFFNHALKSANESKMWLTLLIDLNLGDKTESGRLLKELTEIANILASSIITLKGRK